MGSSLEDQIQQEGGTEKLVEVMRNRRINPYNFPIPDVYTNWADEQRAWRQTVTLYDQAHMWDVYFRGPDVHKLLADTTVNNYKTFGKDKAKQLVAVNYDGHVIGDAILFGTDDHEVNIVGTPAAANWIRYHAEKGNYEVEVFDDPARGFNPNRLTYRYQLNGPLTQKVIEKAIGGPVDRIKFFNIGRFQIAGREVRALNHTMAGVPGQEMTGLELNGPAADAEAVLEALLAAGEEFGLRQGGARSYVTATLESGWIPVPLPAVYSGDAMKPYREWLQVPGYEGAAVLGGSFVSDNIEDYYVTPWDLGYGHVIDFDHEFVGRDGLLAKKDQPHKRKVWLTWNDDDVAAVIRSSLFDDRKNRAKILELPNPVYSPLPYEAILDGDKVVGTANWYGYSSNIGHLSALATIDDEFAIDGKELTLVWGEPDGGTAKENVEPHVQKNIRVTVSTKALGLNL